MKIKERRFILQTLNIMQHLIHKRQIMIRHLPSHIILRQIHTQQPVGQIAVAPVAALWVGSPDSLTGVGDLPEETEFAFEKEFGEVVAAGQVAVVAAEAECVAVAVGGTTICC